MCIRDTWITSRETCFLCFVQHDARVWKCLCDYFGLRKLKPWKTFSRSYLQRRKTEKRRQIEFSENLRMPKLQEKLHNTVVIVNHRYERLAFFTKCCSHNSALSKWGRSKTFRRSCLQVRQKKIKEEAETKSSVWDLKMPNTLANPRTAKRYETGICIGLFSNRSQKTSTWGENISDTLT